jgi:hypothetical protein
MKHDVLEGGDDGEWMADTVKAAAATTTTMSIMTTMTKFEAAINELKRAKFEADEDEELEDVEQR